jgi:peroxiredoxin
VILELARFVLAGVFLVSAVAKLADRAGSWRALVGFGAPERLARPLGCLVVGAELAVAVALLWGRARVAGALGAVVLVSVFSAVVVVTVATGRRAECHCFGRLSAGRVGWPSVARNALLGALAGYVAVGGALPLFGAIAVVAGAVWLGLRVPLRLRRGAPAPAFSLVDGSVSGHTLEGLLAHKRPLLLVFIQPGCGACETVLPDLTRWHADLAGELTLVVVGGGSASRSTGYPVLADASGAVATAYGVTATPSAVLVDRAGRIASGTARGPAEIRELVAGRFGTPAEPRHSRRTVVARAARGLASVGVLPVIAAACGTAKTTSGTGEASASSTTGHGPGRPKSLRVGKVYVCDQAYALCTDAPCVRSKQNPNIAICDCVVKSGYSIGFHTCSRRAPHGTTLYSDFSTALVTSTTRALTCPSTIPWADCVDSICARDPSDPTKAKCRCQVIKNGPAFTFGGNCDARTCSTTIWSGSSPSLGAETGSPAVKAAMKRLGQPIVLPPPCPKA